MIYARFMIRLFPLFLLLLGLLGQAPESFARPPDKDWPVFGNRIPRDYFVTWGFGESDVTVHAGSYDDALRMAKIENYNLMKYTSVLPPEARQVEIPATMHHGSVLESIYAEISGGKEDGPLAAGVILFKIRKKSDGRLIGGFAAETSEKGPGAKEKVETTLRKAEKEMFARRYKAEEMEITDELITVKEFTPQKRFGTVIVLVGFTNYIFPQLKP